MCPRSLISAPLPPILPGGFPHFSDFWLGEEKEREQDRSNGGRKKERVDNKREERGSQANRARDRKQNRGGGLGRAPELEGDRKTDRARGPAREAQ